MALSYDGHLSDGRTAARKPVSVRLADHGLVIEDADGGRALAWTFYDLRLADELRRGQPVRLLNVAQADARLTIADRGILRPLFAFAPHLRGPGALGRRPALRLVQWAAGVAAVVAVLFYGLPWAAEPVAALMPLAWEEALGEQVMAGLGEGRKPCEAAAGRRALERLTDRLAAVADSPYSFRVRVVDDATVNALAGPGGHIVVFRGLLDDAGSADEVAGVLAHEMGHVIERHATEGMVRAAGLALIVQVLVGDPTGLIGLGAAAGELLLTLSYSRGDEAEADAVAIDMLAETDIDAGGLIRFLERMSRHEGGGAGVVSFLSTHPPSAARLDTVRETGRAGGAAMTPDEWRALKAICA